MANGNSMVNAALRIRIFSSIYSFQVKPTITVMPLVVRPSRAAGTKKYEMRAKKRKMKQQARKFTIV